MAFQTLQLILCVGLVASAAHGQMNEDMATMPDLSIHDEQAELLATINGLDMTTVTVPDVSVHYDQVVSPETFTFNENVAWATRSLLRPEETLGNAVIMYGYESRSACDDTAVRDMDIPAALAVQPHLDSIDAGWGGPALPYSVTLFETIADACEAQEVVQMLANTSVRDIIRLSTDYAGLEEANRILADRNSMQVLPTTWSAAAGPDAAWINAYRELGAASGVEHLAIPGFLPFDSGTAVNFALEVGEIGEANGDSLIFSVGRLPGVGRGLEMWAFCAEVGQCFGHQADASFVSSHFAGLVSGYRNNVPSASPLTLPPAAPDG